jgi:hypothetical protein
VALGEEEGRREEEKTMPSSPKMGMMRLAAASPTEVIRLKRIYIF